VRIARLLVKGGGIVTAFDKELWYITTDFITIYEDRRLAVKFCDGSMISIPAEIWKAA